MSVCELKLSTFSLTVEQKLAFISLLVLISASITVSCGPLSFPPLILCQSALFNNPSYWLYRSALKGVSRPVRSIWTHAHTHNCTRTHPCSVQRSDDPIERSLCCVALSVVSCTLTSLCYMLCVCLCTFSCFVAHLLLMWERCTFVIVTFAFFFWKKMQLPEHFLDLNWSECCWL